MFLGPAIFLQCHCTFDLVVVVVVVAGIELKVEVFFDTLSGAATIAVTAAVSFWWFVVGVAVTVVEEVVDRVTEDTEDGIIDGGNAITAVAADVVVVVVRSLDHCNSR